MKQQAATLISSGRRSSLVKQELGELPADTKMYQGVGRACAPTDIPGILELCVSGVESLSCFTAASRVVTDAGLQGVQKSLSCLVCPRYFLLSRGEIVDDLTELERSCTSELERLTASKKALEKSTKAVEDELRELLGSSPALARALHSQP